MSAKHTGWLIAAAVGALIVLKFYPQITRWLRKVPGVGDFLTTSFSP